MIEVSFSITGPHCQGNMVVTAEKKIVLDHVQSANFHKLHLLKGKKIDKSKYLINMLQLH